MAKEKGKGVLEWGGSAGGVIEGVLGSDGGRRD